MEGFAYRHHRRLHITFQCVRSFVTYSVRTDEYPFEVILSRGKYQLTRAIITPPSPRPRNTDLYTTPVDIWVVKSRYEIRPIGQTTANGDVAVTQLYEQSGFPSGGYQLAS